MGYFKGRFCSMRGLRQQIDNALDHERALAWIKACIVIHTLVLLIEKGQEDPEYMAELLEEGQEPVVVAQNLDIEAEAVRETCGQQMRSSLKAKLFTNLYGEPNPYS